MVSPLTEGRGLKLWAFEKRYNVESVAPHGGAWIETANCKCTKQVAAVAPHGGAWIETHSIRWSRSAHRSSPLTEGRGLKQNSESNA